MKTKKKSRSVIIGVVIILAVFAAIFVFLLIKRTVGTEAVAVYPVADLAQQNYGEEMSTSYGNVRSEGFQNVMLSETQKVNEIFVKEGQKVKAGDQILSYDTTLSELDVEKAELKVRKTEMELGKARDELYRINTLVPHYEVVPETQSSDVTYTPKDTPYYISGEGTKKDPMYYLMDKNDTFDMDFFSDIIPDGQSFVYVVFIQKEYNALNGALENAYGIYVKESGWSYSIWPFTPDVPEDIGMEDEEAPADEPRIEEGGSEYTEAEIAKMRVEKEDDIRQLEIQLNVDRLGLEKVQNEISDSAAIVKEAGTVTVVRDPDEAFKNGQPVVEISAGGGFYIDVFLNELELESVHEGDTVQISTYNSAVMCDGQITKISMLPSQNGDSWSQGNTNVSYYPFTVFVAGENALQDGEYAEVSYSPEKEVDDSIYIENMFVRKDKAGSYVLVKDPDGSLKRRDVVTGKSLWGSYIQIKSGLTTEDFIAFPYGKDVHIGAKTSDAEISSLYNY